MADDQLPANEAFRIADKAVKNDPEVRKLSRLIILHTLADNYPKSIKGKVMKDDVIHKRMYPVKNRKNHVERWASLNWQITNPEIYKRFEGKEGIDKEFYKKIQELTVRNATHYGQMLNLFVSRGTEDSRDIAPFSEGLEFGFGEDLEKLLLMHLRFHGEGKADSFLVRGSRKGSEDEKGQHHSYLVVSNPKGLFILNPDLKQAGIESLYVSANNWLNFNLTNSKDEYSVKLRR